MGSHHSLWIGSSQERANSRVTGRTLLTHRKEERYNDIRVRSLYESLIPARHLLIADSK